MMRVRLKRIRRLAATALSFMLALLSSGAVAVSPAGDRGAADSPAYSGWLSVDGDSVIATAYAEAMGAFAGTPQPQDGTVLLKPEDAVSFPVDIPEAGDYALLMCYRVVDGQLTDSTAEVTACGRSVLTSVYGLWQDETKNYPRDRYGNEVTPNQKLLDEFVTDYVRDFKSLDMRPVRYSFPKGVSSVTVKNCDQDIMLRSVQVVSVEEPPEYAAYAASRKTFAAAEKTIILEGEDYAVKSDSYIRVQSKQNAAVYPYSPYEKRLSTIDCGSYNSAGQRVVWNFNVPADAWYHIAFHYSQPDKEGQSAYRDIEIDGKAPFRELESVDFSYTGNGYENKIVTAGGETAGVYLEKGVHTIGLFTQAPVMQPALEEITGIISELSDIGLSLQQVAGSSADRNRSWDIEAYVPGVQKSLLSLQERLLGLYDELGRQSGTTPASCANLKQAAGIIKQVLKKPEKLPSKVSELSVGTGSATELLATLQNDIRLQGIELDRIYLYGGDSLPAASAGIFKSALAGIKRFFYSLFNKNDSYAAGSVDGDVLNVWVNRSVTHVETLQLLTDSYFTPQTGIKVQLSVMPDANKLLLANASDTCPDVALGVPNATPYQLGLRGAAADLNGFEDLSAMVSRNFNSADLEPYVYDGKLYGLPETMQFYVLMYRDDIFGKLGLSVPDTWDDIAEMMPVLRRNGMNFYLPLSSYTGTKGLPGILPFFFQTGSRLYAGDGLTASFNSGEGIKAFETLTDLYSLYSLQNNMPSFYNNFRYGTAPVGVGDFSNYMQILYAAPEIADSWSVALAPGTRDENGEIHRQQMSVDRGAMIMQTAKHKKEAWTFLKWWLSDDTQTEFSHTLLVKFGSDFIWNSANKTAFSRLSLPARDRSVIMKQWALSENYRNLPVTYMLERELSDAWYASVQRGVPARIALNKAAVNVNSELRIKMREFGYTDSSNNAVRAYNMQSIGEILSGVKQ